MGRRKEREAEERERKSRRTIRRGIKEERMV